MLSVVIPALNEAASIEATIEEIRCALAEASIEHEIIVVNDGSSDATGELARRAGAQVLDHPVPGGYGRAIKDGIRKSRYDLIAITDADGTYPNKEIPALYRKVVVDGFDMVVGARTGPEYRGTFLKMPARRVFLWLSEYATGRSIADINSGLRVFRRDIVLRAWNSISDGFSFTTTITLAAMLSGNFVHYEPIPYFKRVGKSHVRYLRDSLRSLQIIVENLLYFNPLKLFLLVANVLLGISFFSGVVAIGAATLAANHASLLFGVMAIMCFVTSFVVGAIGLAADVVRQSLRARPFEVTPAESPLLSAQPTAYRRGRRQDCADERSGAEVSSPDAE